MKKWLIILLAVLSLYVLTPAAYAQQVTYRDARIFGKVVTPDIVYGSLFYRDNNGQYVTHSSRTYIKIEPLHERHYKQLSENINKTVILLGKMNTSAKYASPMFFYFDVDPVDYHINLTDKYYYSFVQSSQQAYGIELKNEKAMGDLIKTIGEHSILNTESDIDQDTRKFLFDYRRDNLRYQFMLGRDESVSADIRGRMASNIFLKGNDGSNILVNKADVDMNDIKKFMNKTNMVTDPTLKEGTMTIYGTFNVIEKGCEQYEYYFTGVAGYTLEHWLDIFKTTERPASEKWQIYNKPDMEKNVLMWATGYRWEEKDEEGNGTGRWYFTPTYWIDKKSFEKGLNNFLVLTSGELKI